LSDFKNVTSATGTVRPLLGPNCQSSLFSRPCRWNCDLAWILVFTSLLRYSLGQMPAIMITKWIVASYFAQF